MNRNILVFLVSYSFCVHSAGVPSLQFLNVSSSNFTSHILRNTLNGVSTSDLVDVDRLVVEVMTSSRTCFPMVYVPWTAPPTVFITGNMTSIINIRSKQSIMSWTSVMDTIVVTTKHCVNITGLTVSVMNVSVSWAFYLLGTQWFFEGDFMRIRLENLTYANAKQYCTNPAEQHATDGKLSFVPELLGYAVFGVTDILRRLNVMSVWVCIEYNAEQQNWIWTCGERKGQIEESLGGKGDPTHCVILSVNSTTLLVRPCVNQYVSVCYLNVSQNASNYYGKVKLLEYNSAMLVPPDSLEIITKFDNDTDVYQNGTWVIPFFGNRSVTRYNQVCVNALSTSELDFHVLGGSTSNLNTSCRTWIQLDNVSSWGNTVRVDNHSKWINMTKTVNNRLGMSQPVAETKIMSTCPEFQVSVYWSIQQQMETFFLPNMIGFAARMRFMDAIVEIEWDKLTIYCWLPGVAPRYFWRYPATLLDEIENNAMLEFDGWLCGKGDGTGYWQWECGPEKGMEVVYTNWARNEPSKLDGCIWYDQGLWYSRSCDETLHVLCKVLPMNDSRGPLRGVATFSGRSAMSSKTPSVVPKPPSSNRVTGEDDTSSFTTTSTSRTSRATSSVVVPILVVVQAPSVGMSGRAATNMLIQESFNCVKDYYDVDVTAHPTQWSVGDTDLRMYVGAVLSNTFLSFGILAAYSAVRLFRSLENRTHLPGAGLMGFVFFFQYQCLFSFRMLVNGDLDTVLISIGILLLQATHIALCAFSYVKKHIEKSERYIAVFGAYKSKQYKFAFIDLGYQLAIVIVTVPNTSDLNVCNLQKLFIVILTLGHVIALALYRPISLLAEQCLIALSDLTTIIAVFIAYFVEKETAEAMLTVNDLIMVFYALCSLLFLTFRSVVLSYRMRMARKEGKKSGIASSDSFRYSRKERRAAENKNEDSDSSDDDAAGRSGTIHLEVDILSQGFEMEHMDGTNLESPRSGSTEDEADQEDMMKSTQKKVFTLKGLQADL